MEIETLRGFTAVGHQVGLQKTGASLLPVGKGAYWNRALQQAARLGGTQMTLPSQTTPWTQQPINSGWAHLAQLCLYWGTDVYLTMLSHHPDQLAQEWPEPLGA
jgi:hypothetical protein